MLRIGICDDERIYQKDLNKIVSTELDLQGVPYQISCFADGESLLQSAEVEGFQIIFLDIEMRGINGMDAAKKIRRKNTTVVLIFITSHPDFVFQGYEVHALNYILKPYKKEKILDVLDSALTGLELERKQFYLIEQRSSTIRLDLDTVKYFFSDKRSVTAVTNTENIVFYGKLNEVEEELPHCFVRVHNRYLVNLKYVEKLDGSSLMIAGEPLPVSRGYKQETAVAFAKYVLE